MMNKKCAVHGSYFGNNFGDTLLIQMMCDYVATIVGKENVYLAIEGLQEEQSRIGYPVVPKNERDSIDYVILGGGGYFGEPNLDSHLRTYLWYLRNYKRHLSWLRSFSKAQFAAIGIGFGPISNVLYRRILMEKFSIVDQVVFRDKESLQFARDYGLKLPDDKIEIGVDFALSIPPREEKGERIAFHLHNLTEEKIRAIVTFFSDSEVYKDWEFVILYDNPTQNKMKPSSYYNRIFNEGKNIKLSFEYYKNVDQVTDFIGGSKLIVTNKLHVGIIGIATGSKVISLPTHQKTIRLYKQLGLEKFCIPINEFSGKKLETAVNNLDMWDPNILTIESGVKKLKDTVKSFLL